MKNFSNEWEKITSDKFKLDIVRHCHIEFINDEEPKQKTFNNVSVFNEKETQIISNEIEKLLDMAVLKIVQPEEGQYFSPIFIRPKKNGEYRMILNLKKLNKFVEYHHFKMDTFENAIKLVTRNCYMASIDLRHAYYSVPIAEEHQKFLCFQWEGKIYQYTCLPNGISSAPRLFTKLMKPVYAKLRNLGYINAGYIDDSLLCGDSVEECSNNVKETVKLMSKLGFHIHKDKSVFKPTKQIIFLGNIIDTENMIVFLTEEKKLNIVTECTKLLNTNTAKIRQVASVIGLIVSSFSAVEYGKLFYRNIENEKILALEKSKGNFDNDMFISNEMKVDLKWWIENVKHEVRHITHGNPEITIQTDASLQGWGAVLDKAEIGGRWHFSESQHHINYLELLAIYLALKSFLHLIKNKHIKIVTDNSTAVSYINNMGGTKSKDCNRVSKDIWMLCRHHRIWLTCTHIAGALNIKADMKSRIFDDQLEWKLDEHVFKKLCTTWDKPGIDLFASRLNNQVKMYCSWKPDPKCSYVNAFSLNWGEFNFIYLFPPFSLLSRCICKLREDNAKGIVIAPLWLTQSWFPRLMELLTDNPIVLPKTKNLLSLHHSQLPHPLYRKLVMIACRVSGKISENKAFQKEQPTFLSSLGNQEPENSIKDIYKNGFSTVVKNALITFKIL